MLQPVPISDQLAWLAADSPQDASGIAGVPNGFAAYFKIMLPFGIDPRIPIAEYSFSVRSIEAINARASFWNTYRIVNGQPSPAHLEPITYREVAARLGLQYDLNFTAGSISKAYGGWPPNLGSSAAMDAEFAQTLAKILGLATAVYFHGSIEEGNYHFAAEGSDIEDWLEAGQAADLPMIVQREQCFPTYTFAANHSWCLYHPEDASWLLLGCAEPLTRALAGQSSLELFRL